MYQDKCPVESELRSIIAIDDLLMTLDHNGLFKLYRNGSTAVAPAVATGSTLIELIENYKARE